MIALPTLYHRTNAAELILSEGFRDHDDGSGFGPGVWLSTGSTAWPDSLCVHSRGAQLLAVTIDMTTEELFYKHEVLQDGQPFREFFFSAELLNKRASIRLLSAEEIQIAINGPTWNEYPPGEPEATWAELRQEDELENEQPKVTDRWQKR